MVQNATTTTASDAFCVSEMQKMLDAQSSPLPYSNTTDITVTSANGNDNVVGDAKQQIMRPASNLARIFCNNFRFFILILGTLCLTSIFSNMIIINFTIICMDPDSEQRGHLSALGANESLDPLVAVIPKPSSQNPQHSYTQFQKTALQWTVSIASGLATFPLSYACTHYGARLPFLISGFMSAVFTALIPLAIDIGFEAFIVMRIFQGLAYACDFAVVGVLCTRWASLHENAIFLAILTSFTPLSSFLTNTSSGPICESENLGWPYAFYFHAIAGFIFFSGWFLFYTDDPQESRFVTTEELSIIHRQKTASHIHHDSFVPYKAICKTPVIWAVWLNAFVDLTCGLFIIIYSPTYIKKVLHYGVVETGFLGGFIILSKLPVKIICGLLSDKLQCLAEQYKMCIFNTIAVCVPGAIYVALCYVPEHIPLLSVLLFTATEAFTGANCGGFYKCGSLASRQYAEFVIACTQFIKCVVFFVAPALVSIFVGEDESVGSKWHIIFFIIAVSLFLANIVFCVYATDQPCEFTQITKQNAKNYNSKKCVKTSAKNKDTFDMTTMEGGTLKNGYKKVDT